MLTPLYGFLQGDTIGLLILAHDTDSVEHLANRLIAAAQVRVRGLAHAKVRVRGQIVDPALTVAEVGLSALDRFDVVTVPPT